jgi:hypothetical protein
MPYVVEKIGRYKGKLLTCQRRLINLTTGQSLGATDIVHALDAALYNIICNPQSPCPLFDPGGRTASQVSHYLDQIMQTKHTSSGEKRPRARKRKKPPPQTLYNDNTTSANRDDLNSVPASEGDSRDSNYNFRRSKRLRDLTEKVHMFYTKTDPLDELNAADIPIPKSFEEAMRSSFSKFWKASNEEEINALKKGGLLKYLFYPKGKWLYLTYGFLQSKRHLQDVWRGSRADLQRAATNTTASISIFKRFFLLSCLGKESAPIWLSLFF